MPCNMPETIAVNFTSGAKADVTVEEFQPIDPAAYQLTAGWTCFDGDVELFVGEDGDVWLQPENTVVGTAPEIKAQADEWERQFQAWEDSEVWDD